MANIPCLIAFYVLISMSWGCSPQYFYKQKWFGKFEYSNLTSEDLEYLDDKDGYLKKRSHWKDGCPKVPGSLYHIPSNNRFSLNKIGDGELYECLNRMDESGLETSRISSHLKNMTFNVFVSWRNDDEFKIDHGNWTSYRHVCNDERDYEKYPFMGYTQQGDSYVAGQYPFLTTFNTTLELWPRWEYGDGINVRFCDDKNVLYLNHPWRCRYVCFNKDFATYESTYECKIAVNDEPDCQPVHREEASMFCLTPDKENIPIFAVPCNGVVECVAGVDEMGCSLPIYVLLIIWLIGALVIFGLNFLFKVKWENAHENGAELINEEEETEEDTSINFFRNDFRTVHNTESLALKLVIIQSSKNPPSSELNKKYFNLEMQFHNSLSETLICLKKRLDATTCTKILEDIQLQGSGCFSNYIERPFLNAIRCMSSKIVDCFGPIFDKLQCCSSDETQQRYRKIALTALRNTVSPFVAFQDIAKDVFLLIKVGIALGGFYVLWSNIDTLPSTIALLLALSITLPMLLSGIRLLCLQPDIFTTIGDAKLTQSKIWKWRIAIFFTMPFHHAFLRARKENAKSDLNAFLMTRKINMNHYRNLRKNLDVVQSRERQYTKFELGSETILQVAITLVMTLLVWSETRTSQGLLSLFQDSNELTNTALFLLTFSTILSALTYINSQYHCISSYHKFLDTKSKIILCVYCLTSLIARIWSVIVWFSPSLGLFGLLRHYQAEQTLFKTSNSKHRFVNESGYLIYGNATPIDWKQIDRRFDQEAFSHNPKIKSHPGLPLPETLYTVFSAGQVFGIFLGLFILQLILIFVLKLKSSLAFKKLNWLEKLMHIIENSHLAYPVEDWDFQHGTWQDHLKRMKAVRAEGLGVIFINGIFSFFSIIPSLLLLPNVVKRHEILHYSIGALPLEVKAIFWVHLFPILAFVTLFLVLVVNMLLFYILNEHWHPFVKIIHPTRNGNSIEMEQGTEEEEKHLS